MVLGGKQGWMIAGVGVLSALALAAVIWAITAHREQGLLTGCATASGRIDYTGTCAEVVWAGAPLRVRAAGGELWQLGLLDAVVKSLNDELDFPMLTLVAPDHPAEVVVDFNVAAERSAVSYAGRVQHYAAFSGVGGPVVRCDVWLKNVALSDTATSVVRHELGHALGLAHDLEANSLMTDQGMEPGRYYPMSRDDRALLQRLYRDGRHE